MNLQTLRQWVTAIVQVVVNARVENTAAKPFCSMLALICNSIKHAYIFSSRECLYQQSLCQCFRKISISNSLCCQDTLKFLLLKTLWSNSVSWRQSRVLSLHGRSIIIIKIILILVMVFLCCHINIEHEPAEISATFLQLFKKNCTSVTCKDSHENTHFSQCFQCTFAVRNHVSSVASLEFNLRCFIMVRSDLWSTNMCCI